jgi:16S rRNA (cytosine967-C5)-methyltransferase
LTEAAGTPTRRAALKLLDAVLRRGLPLEAALDGACGELDRADDRAFAHAIAAEVLRRMPDLDALIDGATERPIPPDAKARMVLRIALVQALAMKTPQHAAISTALPLLDGGPRKLAHGVFGTIMKAGAVLVDPPHIAAEVAERWTATWGAAAVEAARVSIAAPPPVDLTLKPGLDAAEWATRLEGESLAPGHVRIAAGRRVVDLDGYDEGVWWVQDIAASIPARLAGAGAGRALDLCAAPGGKTMQLAAAGWDVTALDLSEQRLARLADNLDRTGLAATVVEGDAGSFADGAPYDVVLLDAPCSATGIFRRHPDVLHRASPRVIAGLAEQQAALIDHAAGLVAADGVLIYAVCSLEAEEGEQVTKDFIARQAGAWALDPVRADELPQGLSTDRVGRVRVKPGALAERGGADGFFVARFRRG